MFFHCDQKLKQFSMWSKILQPRSFQLQLNHKGSCSLIRARQKSDRNSLSDLVVWHKLAAAEHSQTLRATSELKCI